LHSVDLDEADELIARLDWPRDKVMLMPLAATRDELHERGSLVARAAMQRGYRFSPRLHIELWGGQRGT
jgi:7-carboxy-7-deazaguanine synthase